MVQVVIGVDLGIFDLDVSRVLRLRRGALMMQGVKCEKEGTFFHVLAVVAFFSVFFLKVRFRLFNKSLKNRPFMTMSLELPASSI